jgi:hypothetical protein
MLAVNEAALALFDAADLDRVLGRGIAERFAPEQITVWRDFAARVWTAGSGSCDVDLITADGNRTALLLHGVALSDHPDGIESILIAVRDTSASRRLERMLEDSERRGRTLEETSWHQVEPLSIDPPDLSARLEETQADRQRLADLVDERDAERRQLEAEFAADRVRLQETLAADRQLALLQQQRDAQAVRDDLQAQLAAALAERPRLQTTIDQHLNGRHQAEAEYAAARARLEAALADAEVERHRLAQLVGQRDAERAQREEDHAADLTRLEEGQELVARQRERETQAAHDALQAQLAAAQAEVPQLHRALDEQAESGKRVDAEQAAARAQSEAALAGAHVERRRLADLLEQRDAQQRQLAADHAADLTRLEEGHELVMQQKDREAQAVRDALQAQLAGVLAERPQLQSALDQHAQSRDRVDAEYAAARAQYESVQAQLADAQTERRRLVDLLEQRDAQQRHLEADHAADLTRLEEGHELEVRQKEREAQAVRDDLQAQLAGVLAERPRLQSALDQQAESRNQVDAEYAAARAQRETALAELAVAQTERNRLADLLDQRDAERGRGEAEHAAELTRLEQGHGLAALQKERDAQAVLDDLRAQLARALAEQPRLQATIDEHRGSRDRIDAEYAASRAQFETAQAEGQAERQHLTDLIQQRAAEREALEAAHAADRAQLEQGMAAEQQLVASQRERDAQTALDDLRTQLAAALAEQPRLQAAIDEHRANRDRIDAEYAAARAQFETAQAEGQAERQRLADLVEQRAAERQALEAAHAADRTQLEQEMAARQQLAVGQLERDSQAARDALHAQLAAALAEQPRLQATIDQHRESRDRIDAEYAAARAELEAAQAEGVRRDAERRALEDREAVRAEDIVRVARAVAEEHQQDLARRDLEHRNLLAEMRVRLDGAFTEHERVAQVLEQQEARYRLLEREHATALAEVQEALREQRETALSSREQGARQLGEAQVQLAQATANHHRVQLLLAESESWQMQVAAEHAADRMRAERALAHATLERTLVLKALADLRVELQAAGDNARALETLAAAGRVNPDVGRELDAILTDLGTTAKHLLGLAPLEAPYRREVETLAAATLRAESLARQFRYVESSESEAPPETL